MNQINEISSCINDNILDLNEEAFSSDNDLSNYHDQQQQHELQQSDKQPIDFLSNVSPITNNNSHKGCIESSPKNDEQNRADGGCLPVREKSQSFAIVSQSIPSMDRQKILKMYAKATIDSAGNMQQQLIARAEMKTYSNAILQGEIQSESSRSSSSQDSSNDSDDNDCSEEGGKKEAMRKQKKKNRMECLKWEMRQRHHTSYSRQTCFSQQKIEGESSLIPVSSPSSSSPTSFITTSSISPMTKSEVQKRSYQSITATSFSQIKQEQKHFNEPNVSQQAISHQPINENFSSTLMSSRRMAYARQVSSDKEEEEEEKSSDEGGYIPFPTSNPGNYSFEVSTDHPSPSPPRQLGAGIVFNQNKLIKVQKVESEENNSSIANQNDSEDFLVDSEARKKIETEVQQQKESLVLKKNLSEVQAQIKRSSSPPAKMSMIARKRMSMNLSVAVEQTNEQRKSSITTQPFQLQPKMSTASEPPHQTSCSNSPKKVSSINSSEDLQFLGVSSSFKKIAIFNEQSLATAAAAQTTAATVFGVDDCANISPTSSQHSQRFLILDVAAELDQVRLRGSEDSNSEWRRKVSNESCCSTFHHNASGSSSSYRKKSSSGQYQFNQDYLTYLAFRPPYWEYFAVTLIRDFLVKQASTSVSTVPLRIIFQNVGNSNSISRIVKMKEDIRKKHPKSSLSLHAETAAAFLFFSSSRIRNGQTMFKCEPAIGTSENREFLVNASKLNLIDVLTSYHFPVEPEYKQIFSGDFRRAFSGICTAGVTLQSAWTSIYKSAYHEKEKASSRLRNIHENKKTKHLEKDSKQTQALLRYMVAMLSTKPAKILNIAHLKGSITAGKYADLTVWDPFGKSKRVNIPESYKFKQVHIFDHKKLLGTVHATIIRGSTVYAKGLFPEDDYLTNIPLTGKLLTKKGVI